VSDGSVGRLLGALVAPGETFRSIAVRPSWLAPLLLLVAVSTLVGYLVVERIDYEQAMRRQNERTGGQLSGEQIEQNAERLKKLAPVLALVQGLVVAPAVYLLIALLFWVGFKLTGSDLTYVQSLATALHALLPGAVAAVLTIPVVMQHGVYSQEEVRSGNLLASSLAVVAPAGSGPALAALLGSVDLFVLWTLGLLIVGYRATAKVSRQAAVAVVLTLWLLYVGGKVGLAALLPA
jgi:hypothetical protein